MLVLNQYRNASGYKDVIGERYHFPNRYLSRFGSPPVPFVYYEPREGGMQVYFGTGIIRTIVEDTEDEGHSYADVDSYQSFAESLKYHEGPGGTSWEDHKTMRSSVRSIPKSLFDQLTQAGGVIVESDGIAQPNLYESRLEDRWSQVKDRNDPLSLRKKRRILEAFERPSWVTNQIKRTRGDKCSLCGQQGFLKRGGSRYCEVHHVLHLSKSPPPECLGPAFLVVVCANCHRRFHYADVGEPAKTEGGWTVEIDGTTEFLRTE
jgi:hypothetical protein